MPAAPWTAYAGERARIDRDVSHNGDPLMIIAALFARISTSNGVETTACKYGEGMPASSVSQSFDINQWVPNSWTGGLDVSRSRLACCSKLLGCVYHLLFPRLQPPLVRNLLQGGPAQPK